MPIIDVQILSGSDDADQTSAGVVNLTNAPLFNTDGANEWNAFRFTGITIPKYAQITSACLIFVYPSSTLDEPDLRIYGELSGSPLQYVVATNNISSRNRTISFVDWGLTNAGQLPVATSNLVTIVQELYNNFGPYNNGSMAFMVTSRAGIGTRDSSIQSFTGGSANAAKLHIEYELLHNWVERTNKRTKTGKHYSDLITHEKVFEQRLGTYLHYPSGGPDSNILDSNVDMTPIRVDNATFDGWRITQNDWHYAVGRDLENHGTEDGWIGFGGRQGQNWLKFRLTRFGYLHWPTRAWDDIGGAPTYDRTGGNLSQIIQQLSVGPNEDIINVASKATWNNIWVTPGGGQVNISWQVEGKELKEEIFINQNAREWVEQNRPPSTPVNETYFGAVFRIDASDIPRWVKNGILQDIQGDFNDDDGLIEIRDSNEELGRLLVFMPIDYCWSENNLENKIRLHKRIWLDGDGNVYLLVGALALELAGLSVGGIVFDPTLTTQPNGTVGKDTLLQNNTAGTPPFTQRNFGGADYLSGRASENGRSLIEYDVSSVPATAICGSVTHYLYKYASESASAFSAALYSIAAANAAWIEGAGTGTAVNAAAGEPCWNALAADGSGGVTTAWAGSAGCATSGTDYESSSLGGFSGDRSDAAGTEYATTLTASRVQGWFGASNTNYGLLCLPSGNGSIGHNTFCSSEYITAERRPKLVIYYSENSLDIAVTRTELSTSIGNNIIITEDMNETVPLISVFVGIRATTSGSQSLGASIAIGLSSGSGSLSGSSNQYHMSMDDVDGLVSSNPSSHNSSLTGDPGFIELLDVTGSGVADGEASVSQFITNGIILNTADAFSGCYLGTYAFIGGVDVQTFTRVKDLGNTSGSYSAISLPWEADLCIVMLGDYQNNNNGEYSLGFIYNNKSGSVIQRMLMQTIRGGRNPSEVYMMGRNDACIGELVTVGGLDWYGQAANFSGSGFTIQSLNDGANGRDAIVLAMRFIDSASAIKSNVWTYTTPTDTGLNTDSGAGFQPIFVMYINSLIEAINTAYDNSMAGAYGVSLITSGSQFSSWITSQDNVSPTNTRSGTTASAIVLPNDDGSVKLAASLSSMGTTGPIFNWESSASKLLFGLGIGYSGSGGGGSSIIQGQVTLYGNISKLLNTVSIIQSLSALSGTIDLTSFPVSIIPAIVNIIGLSFLEAIGVVASFISGQASLSGQADLISLAVKIINGYTITSGEVALLSQSLSTIFVSAILSGNADNINNARLLISSFTELIGSANFDLRNVNNILSSSVLLGQIDLLTSATLLIQSLATLTGQSDLSGQPILIIPSRTELSGIAELIATYTTEGIVNGSIVLTGRNDLLLQVLNLINAHDVLSADGSVLPIAFLNIPAFTTLEGLAFLIATGIVQVPANVVEGQAILSGQTDLILTALNIVNGSFVASADAVLSAQSLVNVLSNAILSGEGNNQVNAILLISAISVLYGAGVLTPVGTVPSSVLSTVPLARTLLIPYENRIYLIDQDGRIFLIKGEDRVYNIGEE